MAATQNTLSPRSELIAPVPVTRRMRTWDKLIFDTLVLTIGAVKMQATLEMFSESLIQKARVLADERIDTWQVRYQVHDLASTSGFLGFERLFKRCLELLAADKPIPRAKRIVLSEIQTALSELDSHMGFVKKRGLEVTRGPRP